MADKVPSGKPRVIVYGTLKQGHGNHRLLEGQEFLGRIKLDDKFVMYNLGPFPAVVHLDEVPEEIADDVTTVFGEVYSVDTECLAAMDVLEGNGRYYTRKKVPTKEFKNAWIYLFPKEATKRYPRSAIVEGGLWRPSAEEREWVDAL